MRLNAIMASEAILTNMAIAANFDKDASKDFGKYTKGLLDG